MNIHVLKLTKALRHTTGLVFVQFHQCVLGACSNTVLFRDFDFNIRISEFHTSSQILYKMIEIERKFVFTDNTVAQLLKSGARLVKETELLDEYFDTDDFKLTLADFWLRQRNGDWQLKCPVVGHTSLVGSDSYGSVYREVDDTDKILELLRPLLKATSTSINNRNLVNFLGLSSCRVFASIGTHRSSYDLDGFSVDLDCTDSGYRIGEIEVMVPDESHISEADKRIKSFAEKMGFCTGKRIPGKMDMHLRQHSPLHYEALVNAKILRTDEYNQI